MSGCSLQNLGKLQIPVSYVDKYGQQGIPGPAGNTVLSGIVPPTPEDGVDGDFFIDTATSTLYGPKASGEWPAGDPLIGPPGPQGVAVLNTGYGAFSSELIQTWVQAKEFSLPASYIQNENDCVEIEVQGTILASSMLPPPSGRMRVGKIRLRWASDGSIETPLIPSPVSLAPNPRAFIFKASFYVKSDGNLFFNYSAETYLQGVFPQALLTPISIIGAGEVSLSDPSVPQDLYVDIWNQTPGAGAQVQVDSFVIKSYNAA